ncbi:MAG TPA: hypothetical protein VFW71_06130 [Actinomycetota bacterium]|nr:hypothetical protein [Actinomycetota bacterium]
MRTVSGDDPLPRSELDTLALGDLDVEPGPPQAVVDAASATPTAQRFFDPSACAAQRAATSPEKA